MQTYMILNTDKNRKYIPKKDTLGWPKETNSLVI